MLLKAERKTWASLVLAVVSVTVVGGESSAVLAQEQGVPIPDRPAIAGRRIVKRFDFDEQRFGNYDPLPMNWARHGEAGFPVYLEGRFDTEFGHTGAPSFRLDLNGGSLGFHYQGRDISVRTNSDYLVVAWVAQKGLETARAYVTACYLDRKGNRLSGTERRSELVGGMGAGNDWVPLMVGLPGNVSSARYVGISLWVVQDAVWRTTARPVRSIDREDVEATVWFDDITVYRLPRVTLRTSNPGNVFTTVHSAAAGSGDEASNEDPSPVKVYTEVSDPDGLNLSAQLRLFDAAGSLVDASPIPVLTSEGGAVDPLIYPNLPVGWYEAVLVVETNDGTELVRRSLRLVRLAPHYAPPADAGRGFGLILRHVHPELLAGQGVLLGEVRPEIVKIPVWQAQQAALGEDKQVRDIGVYLEAIAEQRADPVGVLMDAAPEAGGEPSRNVRTMLQIFSDDPRAWRPLVAGVWSRYAGLIHVWQIGRDGDSGVFLDDSLPTLARVLRREMKSLIAEPLLATTGAATYAPPAGSTGDYRVVSLPDSVAPQGIADQLAHYLQGDLSRLWVTIEPLSESLYPRVPRLTDLSRRLAEVYSLGVGCVFLDAPWDTACTRLGVQVDPREDFIVFRTVADVLGGTRPVARMTINGQVDCLLFDRNGRAVMMVWDDHAPPEGSEHVLYLGEEARQIDIWGRPVAMGLVGTQRIVRVGQQPSFIVNTPTWLMDFRRQFRLTPSIVEATYENSEQDLTFRNTYHEPISGLVRLVTPPDWEVRPNRIPFILQPGEEFHHPVVIRFPLNAESKMTPLLGEFDIDANQRYRIRTPAWFELGLENIDLATHVYRVGNRVVVRQLMTNRTDQSVSFQGYLIAPGRKRIVRSFLDSRPGQTMRKDFILEDAADLAGQRVRIGLREMQGSRVWNSLVTIP